MKQIITFSIICLIGFGAQAQDLMMNKLKEIKTELNLTKEQNENLNRLIKVRKESLNSLENETIQLMSEDDMKKKKIEKMKQRKEVNTTFRNGFEEILDEKQIETLNQLMPLHNKTMMHKEETEKKTPHKHKNGEEHTH